jgi:hypothetical protein
MPNTVCIHYAMLTENLYGNACVFINNMQEIPHLAANLPEENTHDFHSKILDCCAPERMG